MTDDELHSQAYLFAVGALEPDEVRVFEAHLARCAECETEVAAMNEVTAHLSDMVSAEPPSTLRSAVLAEIAQTAQDATANAEATVPTPRHHAGGRHVAAPTAEAPPPSAPTPEATVTPIRRSWRDRPTALVAAAAVVAAVALGGWAIKERNDANDARGQIATAQKVAAELTAIINAGDAQTVSATTDNGATTTVLRSARRGTALLLATDLPALPAGKTYQAWTIDDERPTSAGTFASQGKQTALELPPAAVQTSTIAVTVEPAGGSDQPTTTPIVALSLG
jgi:anti-sigma-K factor RskA